MKLRPALSTLFLALLAPLAVSAKDCACADCKCGADCACAAKAEKPDAPLHPLVGVVREVMPDRQALLVKHEEIPGFMKAMTMLLRVEPEVLTRVKTGDAITAKLGRDADGKWFLRDVAVTAPAS